MVIIFLLLLIITIVLAMIFRRLYINYIVPEKLTGTDYLMAKKNNCSPKYCYARFEYSGISDKDFINKCKVLKNNVTNMINKNGIICNNFDYVNMKYFNEKINITDIIDEYPLDNVYQFFDNKNINKQRPFVIHLNKKLQHITFFWNHTVHDGMRFYNLISNLIEEKLDNYQKTTPYILFISELILLIVLITKLLFPIKSYLSFEKIKNTQEISNIMPMKKVTHLRTKLNNIKTVSIIVGIYIKHVFNSTKKNKLSIAILYGFIDKRFKNNTSGIFFEIENMDIIKIIYYVDNVIKTKYIDIPSIAYYKNYFDLFKLEEKYKKNKIDIYFMQFYTNNDYMSNHVNLCAGENNPSVPLFCHCYSNNNLINYYTKYNTKDITLDNFKNNTIFTNII